MCLNRHYSAEGVRLYSQRNWVLMVGNDGKTLLAKHITAVVDFYVSQAKAPNHAVREAACNVIAELAAKVDPDAVRPHIGSLIGSLIDMFKDGSWPVRDAACLATGRFVLSFPDESAPSLDELYPLWFAHLSDNIPSVREDTAVALGNVMRAYGDEAVSRVLEVLRKDLGSAKEQPAESSRLGGMANVTQFGVAEKKERDNDPELHTGQLMYSCGSLIARNVPAKAGSTEMLVAGGGDTDHGLSREAEPWERTDGCVALVRELALYKPDAAVEFMGTVAEMADLRHFAHYFSLIENIWRHVPLIARAVGRITFEPFIEVFVRPLSHAVKCGNRLAEDSAKKAVQNLKRFVGPEALYPL